MDTVGPIIERVEKDLDINPNARFDNLVRIGVDETSYRKGHKYITTVVNHDTGNVIWVAKGHGKTIFEQFFKLLTPEQRNSIQLVSGDGAKWIDECITQTSHLNKCLRGCRTSKYFLLGGSPALCPNGGEIGCDFAPIPYKHSSFPAIPFGMPDFKLFCFQPLKSMLSLMKKDDSPFFRSESCNEAY